MIGTLKQSEVEEVLCQQVVAHIGCHADGITYVVPISYAYDGTYVYGHSREGLKIELMRKNPAVCFQVDNMQDMANWKSVVSWGDYEELNTKEERDKALKCLVDRVLPLVSSETTHLFPDWPFPNENFDAIKGIVFRIRLENKSGRYEANTVTSD